MLFRSAEAPDDVVVANLLVGGVSGQHGCPIAPVPVQQGSPLRSFHQVLRFGVQQEVDTLCQSVGLILLCSIQYSVTSRKLCQLSQQPNRLHLSFRAWHYNELCLNKTTSFNGAKIATVVSGVFEAMR